MLGMQILTDAAATAIAAAVPFNPAAGDEWTVQLFKNNYTPNAQSIIDDFEAANFDGYAGVNCAAGAPGKYLNPVTGAWEIRPKEPAGGFEFKTTGVTNLPQTIYGAFMTGPADEVYAAVRFETPIVLTAANQVIDVPQPILQMPYAAFE